MAGTNLKQNSNQFEFVFLQGKILDQGVSLNRPCKRFWLIAPANGGGDQIIIVFLSFQKLSFAAPVGVNQIPNNLIAFPLYMSRNLSSGVNQVCPSIEFRCPFTEFFVNAWAVSPVDGSVVDVNVALVCADDDIKQFTTYPDVFIQLG